jgi:hypothetical protein
VLSPLSADTDACDLAAFAAEEPEAAARVRIDEGMAEKLG